MSCKIAVFRAPKAGAWRCGSAPGCAVEPGDLLAEVRGVSATWVAMHVRDNWNELDRVPGRLPRTPRHDFKSKTATANGNQ